MSDGRSRQAPEGWTKGARALLPPSRLRRLSGAVARCGQECPRSFLLLAALALLLAPPAPAQETAEERFAEASLRYRTALHYDPLLGPPLEALVKLYVGAERADELLALYRNHIAQYPDDAGAKTVLVRLLRRIDRSGADELIATVVPQHPDYAPLQYVLFRFLEERGDARATEALSRAIDLESNASRRNEWIEELLRLSEGETARALARGHLERLLSAPDLGVANAVSLARLAQRHRFWNISVKALEKAKSASPDPVAAVEIDCLLAVALGQLGKRAEAASLLDKLLKRLAADHWRRREILGLRFGVLATEEERNALLQRLESAWKAKDQSESAALDYAEALVAAERLDEAVAVLVEASAKLPKSILVENRTLELLEAFADREAYVRYLLSRLESAPERADLRFRLVKVQYALGRDAAAEQDFLAVVAGLSSAEVSARILELQRYLRGIDRIDAAAGYLERYVREHPTRLDVARELAEIRIATGAEETIGELVGWLQPGEAEVENVLDFSDFLLSEGFAHAARSVVEAKLAAEPKQFELGLELIEILGRDGDADAAKIRIAELREMADTPPRYAQWVAAAVSAHRHLETLPGFFESELNRYQFDDGAWSGDKVEKFLILCEAGRRQVFAARIAEGLRRQLAQPGLDATLKLRLRRVLVAVLESDPASAPEVEEQLKALAAEDASHRADHDLRRALVYHRSGRADLARRILFGIDPTEVGSAALLREAADVFVEYGLLDEADDALETVVRLEPEDVLSRERRLSVLVALGEESTLRAAIRRLRDEAGGIALRERSRRSLDEHLDASYWRSVAALLESGDLAEALPLLASVDQEGLSDRSKLWTEWTRSRILSHLGRETEAREALARFLDRARSSRINRVAFPDGLELSVAAAAKTGEGAEAGKGGENESLRAGFLLANPVFRWAFELPEGRRILRTGRSGERFLVLDDLDWVHCLDAANGKLIWRGFYGGVDSKGGRPRPAAFDAVDGPPALFRKAEEALSLAKAARPFVVSNGRFLLVREGACVAHSVADGTVLWSSALPARGGEETSGGAKPDVLFEVADGRVVLFDPLSGGLQGIEEESGKLLWETSLAVPSAKGGALFSLNAGLRLAEGVGLAYGAEAAVFDTGNGEIVWRFHEGNGARFPIVLRPPREEDEEEEGDVPLASFDSVAETAMFDFQAQSGAGRLEADQFLKSPAALVGPAVFWAESRLYRDEPAAAELSGDALWLMQAGKVRRVSSDLPVASLELPASGALVGRVADHLWFLDGGVLHHADFRRGRTTRLVLGELGGAGELRATMAGRLLIVRGNASFVLVNALSGEVLGRAPLPAPLVEYLAATLPGSGAVPQPAGAEIWQGRLHRREPGQAAVSLPVGDLFAEDRCFSVFGERVVACLEAAPEVAIPPAPAPQ